MGHPTVRLHPPSGNQPGNRLVLVTDNDLHPQSTHLVDQPCRVVVENRVVVEFLSAIPVDNHTVDPRQFHRQQVILQHVRITGVVGADQGIEVRGNLPFSSFDLLRIEVIHRPVPTPHPAVRFCDIPRHVVGQDQPSWTGIADGGFDRVRSKAHHGDGRDDHRRSKHFHCSVPGSALQLRARIAGPVCRRVSRVYNRRQARLL